MSTAELQNLQQRLKLARQVRGLTQDELAERAQVPQAQISRLEGGKTEQPALFVVARVARALELDLDVLVDPDGDKFITQMALEGGEPSPAADERREAPPPAALLTQPSGERDATLLPIARSAELELSLPSSALKHHLLITGQTASGKSALMQRLITSSALAGEEAVVVVDPHGALADDVLTGALSESEEVAERIVVIDLADSSHPIAFNPFDTASEEAIPGRVSAICEALNAHLREPRASHATQLAESATEALLWANIALGRAGNSLRLNFTDLSRFFTDEQFRISVVAQVRKPSVLQHFDPDSGAFEMGSSRHRVAMSAPIVRAVDLLTSHPATAAIFSCSRNQVDLASWVRERKIVLLRGGCFPHQTKLGEVVPSLLLGMLLSETERFEGAPCRLFCDDAPTAFGANALLAPTLAEARKWKLSVVLAAQHPDQFDPQIRAGVLANTASKISFGVSSAAAESVRKGMGAEVSSAVFSSLSAFQFAANVLTEDETGKHLSGLFTAHALEPLRAELSPTTRRLRAETLSRSRRELAAPERPTASERLEGLDRALKSLQAEERTEVVVKPGGEPSALEAIRELSALPERERIEIGRADTGDRVCVSVDSLREGLTVSGSGESLIESVIDQLHQKERSVVVLGLRKDRGDLAAARAIERGRGAVIDVDLSRAQIAFNPLDERDPEKISQVAEDCAEAIRAHAGWRPQSETLTCELARVGIELLCRANLTRDSERAFGLGDLVELFNARGESLREAAPALVGGSVWQSVSADLISETHIKLARPVSEMVEMGVFCSGENLCDWAQWTRSGALVNCVLARYPHQILSGTLAARLITDALARSSTEESWPVVVVDERELAQMVHGRGLGWVSAPGSVLENPANDVLFADADPVEWALRGHGSSYQRDLSGSCYARVRRPQGSTSAVSLTRDPEPNPSPALASEWREGWADKLSPKLCSVEDRWGA